MQALSKIAIVVADYDEALDYYVGVLGFKCIEDEELSPQKRWVVVVPDGGGTALLLAKAKNDEQRAAIGNQTGGRVGFFLGTERFETDYARYLEAGVDFIEEPRDEPYGQVVVFRDLYGNLWDLVGKN